MKRNLQGNAKGSYLWWLTLLVSAWILSTVNAREVPATVAGYSHAEKRRKTGFEQAYRILSRAYNKEATKAKTPTGDKRLGFRHRKRHRVPVVGTRASTSCRCEYPEEGVYAATTKSHPRPSRHVVVNSVTVLPFTFAACKGVVFVCADTPFNGPLWNFDCSGGGSTELAGFVVIIPRNYFLCKCETSHGSPFDLVPGGNREITSSPTISPGPSVNAKNPKPKSAKRPGGVFASKRAGRLVHDSNGVKRQLISYDSFGNHRVLKGDRGTAKGTRKGGKRTRTEAPTVTSRFYPPIRCSAPSPVAPTTLMPSSSEAPSLATQQPTSHIISVTEPPSLSPTISVEPSTSPTISAEPSLSPTMSVKPSMSPTITVAPSESPSIATGQPTSDVIAAPTRRPTFRPTEVRTPQPSPLKVIPFTPVPSVSPSHFPTIRPATPSPTYYPTVLVTQNPTFQPTARVIPATLPPANIPTMRPTDEDIPSQTWFPTLDFYDMNERLTCIAVVDDVHVSADELIKSWAKFRKDYPLRSFCLLQPLPDDKSELHIPAAFETDMKAIYFQVNRDYGVAAAASDWFDLCGLGQLEGEGITKVAIAIDTPQLYSATYVRAAYELFVSKITAKRVALIQVSIGPDENWLSPFLQTFL